MPLEPQAWLRWEGDRSVHQISVRLLDISRGGAAVESDCVPPPNRSLLFGLAGSSATDEVLEATVVRMATATDRQGVHRINLAFTTICPDALLKRAIYSARGGVVRFPWLAALAAAGRTIVGRARRHPRTIDRVSAQSTKQWWDILPQWLKGLWRVVGGPSP